MITSPRNDQLKTIRLLHAKRHRTRTGLFVAEGEDLVEAAERAGIAPEALLVSGEDVEPHLLAEVSTLGSGARAIGVYRQRFSEQTGDLGVYLEGVGDPGNVGAIIRSAHALCDGPVALGPGCADPYSPKAVRASMGSIFARPPARAAFSDLRGTRVALGSGLGPPLSEIDAPAPVWLCLGNERAGLSDALIESAEATAHLPLRAGGPASLNVAMAATVALYERVRMAPDG